MSRSQEEIDLVARDGKDYLFCECKWRNEKLDASVLRGLKAKAEVFGGKRKQTYFALFSKSGFTDALLEEAEKDSSILLVDLDEIMV